MRGARLIASVAVMLVAGSVCGTVPVAGATAPPASIWSIAPTPNPGHGVFNALLEGVSARAGDDAWAVGSDSAVHSGSLAEHWNGAAWSAVPTPRIAGRSADLHDVTVLSPTDAWAVGDARLPDGTESFTLVEHWNGSRWTVVPSPNRSTGFGASNTLDGVSAAATDDIWATGWAVDMNTNSIVMLFEHWNGRRWTIAPTPSPIGSFQFATAIAVVGPDDAWAVGYDNSRSPTTTLAAHWNGSAWSIVPTPNLRDGKPPDNKLENVTAVGPDDVWAVGYEDGINGTNKQRTLTEHWDGDAWSIVPSPSPSGGGSELFGVTAVSTADVWAVGESRNFDTGVQRSLTMQWNGHAWSVAPSPNGQETTTPLDATSLATASGASVWAAGGTELPGQCCLRTLVLHTETG